MFRLIQKMEKKAVLYQRGVLIDGELKSLDYSKGGISWNGMLFIEFQNGQEDIKVYDLEQMGFEILHNNGLDVLIRMDPSNPMIKNGYPDEVVLMYPNDQDETLSEFKIKDNHDFIKFLKAKILPQLKTSSLFLITDIIPSLEGIKIQ